LPSPCPTNTPSTPLPYTTRFRSGMYAVHHGPEGLRAIARQVHTRTAACADALTERGFQIVHRSYFDTLRVRVPSAPSVVEAALRSEEHTSELQSRFDLVCRLLLE